MVRQAQPPHRLTERPPAQVTTPTSAAERARVRRDEKSFAVLAPPPAAAAASAAPSSPPKTGTAPPKTGTAPPKTGTAPPKTGTAPSKTGTAPPKTGTAPPKTGTAPPSASRGGVAQPESLSRTPRAPSPKRYRKSGPRAASESQSQSRRALDATLPSRARGESATTPASRSRSRSRSRSESGSDGGNDLEAFETLSVGEASESRAQDRSAGGGGGLRRGGGGGGGQTVVFKVSHVQIFDEYVLKRDDRTNVTFVSSLPQEPHPGYVSLLTDMRAEAHANITMVDVAAEMNPDVTTVAAASVARGGAGAGVQGQDCRRKRPGAARPAAGSGLSTDPSASASAAAAAASASAGSDDDDDDEVDALACLWCGSRIAPGHRPVGCPVDWMPAQIIRTSFSEIGRDDFTMKENVMSHAIRGRAGAGGDDAPATAPSPDGGAGDGGVEKDAAVVGECDTRPAHYKTRWVFDNMNCMLAFAIDRRDVPEYVYSVSLAHKLFAELFPDALHELQVAPHWSLLKRNGGFLTKKKFDRRIGVVVFIDHGAVELPVFKPYGRLVSTKLTFTPESSAVKMMLR